MASLDQRTNCANRQAKHFGYGWDVIKQTWHSVFLYFIGGDTLDFSTNLKIYFYFPSEPFFLQFRKALWFLPTAARPVHSFYVPLLTVRFDR